MYTYVVIDDEPLIRRGILKKLENYPGIQCVAQASNGKAALEQALLAVPGVQTAEADYESGLILVTGTAEKELLLRAISKAAEA